MWKTLLLAPWRALRAALRALLILLLLFEEWGWEPLQRGMARLGRLPLLRSLEARVAALPPKAALAVFLLPTLLLLPVKLLALGLIGHGHAVIGLMVVLAAKLVGTAIVARLYTLTQPALLSLPWFARWHGRWITWKEALLDRLRRSRFWREWRVMRRRWGRGLRRSWARLMGRFAPG